MRFKTDGDKRELSRLYLEGWKQKDLAHHFKTSESTISQELKRGCTWQFDINGRKGYCVEVSNRNNKKIGRPKKESKQC